MYAIVEQVIGGTDSLITAISGVILCIIIAECTVMLFKVFRFILGR